MWGHRRSAAGDDTAVGRATGALVPRRELATRTAVSGLLATCGVEFLQVWRPVWLQGVQAAFVGASGWWAEHQGREAAGYYCGAVFIVWIEQAAKEPKRQEANRRNARGMAQARSSGVERRARRARATMPFTGCLPVIPSQEGT